MLAHDMAPSNFNTNKPPKSSTGCASIPPHASRRNRLVRTDLYSYLESLAWRKKLIYILELWNLGGMITGNESHMQEKIQRSHAFAMLHSSFGKCKSVRTPQRARYAVHPIVQNATHSDINPNADSNHNLFNDDLHEWPYA